MEPDKLRALTSMKPCDRFSLDAYVERGAGAFPWAHAKDRVREDAVWFANANGVEGDYLEFGTYRGDGLLHAYFAHDCYVNFGRTVAETGNRKRLFIEPNMIPRPAFQQMVSAVLGRRFVAFDSFEGVSAPTESYEALFGRGDFNCPLEDWTQNLKDNGVDLSRFVAVKGWFKDSLNAATRRQYNLQAASVVWIDCDLYEPARDALDFVTELVVDGTVIVLDDYFMFRMHPGRGERAALTEWLQKNPQVRLSPFTTVNSFVVHK